MNPKAHMDESVKQNRILPSCAHDGVFNPDAKFPRMVKAKHKKVSPTFHGMDRRDDGEVTVRPALKYLLEQAGLIDKPISQVEFDYGSTPLILSDRNNYTSI